MSASYIVYSRFPTGEKRKEFAPTPEQLYRCRHTCAALGFTVHEIVDNFIPPVESDPMLNAFERVYGE